MKKNNSLVILVLIVIAVFFLSYSSYNLGKDVSDNNLGPLMMVMNIDSNFVTTGIYETLPNNIKKTIQFYIADTPTVVKDVKLYAEVKYATVAGKQVNFSKGKIWNLIKQERIFQRKLNTEPKKNKNQKEKENIPQSGVAVIINK